MSECVTVVGAGSWGTTLAKIVGENGHDVLLWGRREDLCRQINESRQNEPYLPGFPLPSSVTATADLEQACAHGRLMLIAVPSHGFRQIASQIGPSVDGEHLIVHCTKGIEEPSCKRMSEIIREETPARRLGVLAGPNLSVELARRQRAGTLLASRYDEVFRRVQGVLQNDYFRVYCGRDVVGTEIGSAFKNVVAVAAGMVDGLAMGDNTKALLMTRGLNEMVRLGLAMGAEEGTFGSMATLGDLVATCVSQFSRNRQLGARLAGGERLADVLGQMRMVAEGVNAARGIRSYGQRHGLRLPITQAVHRVLFDGGPVADVIADLMFTRSNGDAPCGQR